MPVTIQSVDPTEILLAIMQGMMLNDIVVFDSRVINKENPMADVAEAYSILSAVYRAKKVHQFTIKDPDQAFSEDTKEIEKMIIDVQSPEMAENVKEMLNRLLMIVKSHYIQSVCWCPRCHGSLIYAHIEHADEYRCKNCNMSYQLAKVTK